MIDFDRILMDIYKKTKMKNEDGEAIETLDKEGLAMGRAITAAVNSVELTDDVVGQALCLAVASTYLARGIGESALEINNLRVDLAIAKIEKEETEVMNA